MAKQLSVARMRRRRSALARRLGRRGEIVKGSLVMRWTRCGRAGCRCASDRRHGPYLYVSVFRGRRTRSVYVPQHMAKEVRRWVDNARQLERDVARITWLNAQLLRRESASETSGRSRKPAR